MKIWIITGESESGDDYGPVAYKRKRTDDELSELAHGWDGSEDFSGPGDYGSYVTLTETEVELND